MTASRRDSDKMTATQIDDAARGVCLGDGRLCTPRWATPRSIRPRTLRAKPENAPVVGVSADGLLLVAEPVAESSRGCGWWRVLKPWDAMSPTDLKDLYR